MKRRKGEKMTLVLIVDDMPAMAEQYAYDLRRLGNFDTMIAVGGSEAIDILGREAIDCVILDLEMPGIDGFNVLGKMRGMGLRIPVIVYTGTGNYDRCVKAMRLGAYSFIDKSETMERVVWEIEKGLEHIKLEMEVKRLREDSIPPTVIKGSSGVIEEMKRRIHKVAAIPSPVLVVGESGTGKELVARAVHDAASLMEKDPDDDRPGKDRAFIAVNSAAFPENLIESELFGHERGAFTGANRIHRGAFERASGGTLFLDEIGELPLPAQAKMLRVLEQRQVTRIGGEKTIEVDAKVVAATNRDLETEVEAGRFRQDLFYRLNVHIIEVPPLRERLSDIPEISEFLLGRICDRFGMRRKSLSPECLSALMSYDWSRNNVRELKNILERMVIAGEDDILGPRDIPPGLGEASIARGPDGAAGPDRPRTFQELKAEAERQIIVKALERNEYHISNTARDLGLADHASLLKIMRRHNLKRK